MKRRIHFIGLLMTVVLFTMLIPVYALTPVDVRRICNITLENYPGEGGHFYFYKVADVDEDMEFILTKEFAPYEEHVIVNDIQDQEQWASLAHTLPSYVYGDGIPYKYDGYIKDGNCTFEMETGLYLLLSEPVEYDGWLYRSLPMLVSIPTGDGYIADVQEWIYDCSIVPKHEKEPVPEPEEKEYKVVKQWLDGKGEKRPPVIEVNIIKNGEIVEEVTLNEDNDWCYTWTAVDDGSEWYVQEINIPIGYQVKNSNNETIYAICNYHDVPNTSDPTDVKTPLIGLCAGGTVALIAGFLLLRSREETE